MISSIALTKKKKSTTSKADIENSKDLSSNKTSDKDEKEVSTTKSSPSKIKKKHKKKKRKLVVKAAKPETKEEILAKFNITPESNIFISN